LNTTALEHKNPPPTKVIDS